MLVIVQNFRGQSLSIHQYSLSSCCVPGTELDIEETKAITLGWCVQQSPGEEGRRSTNSKQMIAVECECWNQVHPRLLLSIQEGPRLEVVVGQYEDSRRKAFQGREGLTFLGQKLEVSQWMETLDGT